MYMSLKKNSASQHPALLILDISGVVMAAMPPPVLSWSQGRFGPALNPSPRLLECFSECLTNDVQGRI